MICRRVEFIPAAAKINRTYAKSIPARVEMLPAGVEIISGGVETASASLELIPTAAPQTFSNGKSASATQMLLSAACKIGHVDLKTPFGSPPANFRRPSGAFTLPAGTRNLLARGREPFDGGAVEDVAVGGVEAGAVAGAVPGFLLVVEGDDAPQVGADGGELVERAGVVAEEGHFREAA